MLESSAMSGDLVLINGNIRTLDRARPQATAFVAQRGTVVYVGDDREALALRPPNAPVLDAGRRLVLPGFTDSHIHFTDYARSLEEVNLENSRSLEEAVARVAARLASALPGEVIFGSGWNHLEWVVPVFPDKSSLDPVAPDHPVILYRKDKHSAWLNSTALIRFGITRETPDPPGGKFERGADGEPNGLVRENAVDLIESAVGSREKELPRSLLLRAIAEAHKAGLTGIHNIEGASALRAWQELYSTGQLKLRVVHAIPNESLEHALALGLRRGFGNEWLRLQAVKFFADGSLGSQTAEMKEPFADSHDTGMALTDQATLLARAREAARGGLDVWIHAIGDAAISRVLSVLETLREEGYRENIFRIEHVQHLDPNDLPRLARARVIASVQPIHQPSDMQMAGQLLGARRARYSYAYNSLQAAGATLAFGSDCPVETLQPLRGIHAAVTRQNDQAQPASGWFPEERLSVEAAVEAYTRGAAAAGGDQEVAGSLAPGRRADAILLSEDIFQVPPEQLLSTRIDYTLVGGEIVYCR